MVDFKNKILTRYQVEGMVATPTGSFGTLVEAKYNIIEKIKENWREILKKSFLALIAGLIAQQAMSPMKIAKGIELAAKKHGIEVQVKPDAQDGGNSFEIKTKDGGLVKLKTDGNNIKVDVKKESEGQGAEKVAEAFKDALKQKTKDINSDYGSEFGSDMSPKKAEHLKSLEKIIDDYSKNPDKFEGKKEIVKKAVNHLAKVQEKVKATDYGGKLDTKKLEKVSNDLKEKHEKDAPEDYEKVESADKILKDLLTGNLSKERFDTYLKKFADHPDMPELKNKIQEFSKKIDSSGSSDYVKKNAKNHLARFMMSEMLNNKHSFDKDIAAEGKLGSKSFFQSPTDTLKGLEKFAEAMEPLLDGDLNVDTALEELSALKDTYNPKLVTHKAPNSDKEVETWSAKWKVGDRTKIQMLWQGIDNLLNSGSGKDIPSGTKAELKEGWDMLRTAYMDLNSSKLTGN